jgi:hypothetical protein
MPLDSLYIDKAGDTWSIRELLVSDQPRVCSRVNTASLWSRTSFLRCWGDDLPSPGYILAHARLLRVDESAEIRYEDTVEDHERRIIAFVRLLEQGSALEPLVIGADGSLWDGMHRLAALYACHVEEVEVLDFSAARSKLFQPPVSLDGVMALQFRSSAGIRVLHEQFSKAEPYKHLFVPKVFDPKFADAMLWEMEGLPWTLSTTEFYEQYEVSLLDTEQSFNDTAFDRLREVAMSASFRKLISAITGKGGLKVADVACHRSTTDQQIGIHNDFYPGGEKCRFTIHLNPAWQLNEGGLFVTFGSEDSSTMKAAYLPIMNSALVFEISPKSFHAVTAVTSTRPRYSIVISFLQEDSTGPLDSEATRLADIRQNKLPLLRPDVVDVQSLKHLRTRRCAPMSCGGLCCRDGAGLLPEEMTLLNQIAVAYAEELRVLGVSEPAVEKSGSYARTSTITRNGGHTNCSWLTPDGRCSLQVLGENHIQQPLFYKPLACILMPLRVRSRLGARVLTADHRAFDRSTMMDPCVRYDETAPELESVEDEMAFIAKVWDIDVRAIVDAAESVSFPQSCDASNAIGVVTATQTHLLAAVSAQAGEHIEVLKLCRPDYESSHCSEEESTLRKLPGRWFPTQSERSKDHEGATRMSFVAGHVPLNVWLNTRATENEVLDVTRDLLRALVAMENAQIYHLDLAPRNVLVHPVQRTVVIVDFEDAVDSVREVECAGGSFGFAAPEQYLNYLGQHSRLTESFFVGAVLHHAFTSPAKRKEHAFPFRDFTLIPESLRGLALALIGDPSQFYDRKTRLSARHVLAKMESELPFEVPPNEVVRLPRLEAEQRRLDSPDGCTLFIRRRGLTLLRGETTIDRWNGLVDVTNTPLTWTNPLQIGPLIITADGFKRHREPN